MVRVIMHGCNGRMGQVITEMIAKEAEMEIVAGVDVSDSVHNTYPVFKTFPVFYVRPDFRKNSLRMSKRLPARLRSCALQICPWASTF